MAAVKTITINVDVNTGKAVANIDSLKSSLGSVGKNARGSADGVDRLAKNGGAISLLNNLTGGLASNFKYAYRSISLTNTGLKGTKAAIAATGIGLLVIAIGELVANMDKVVGFFNKASSAAEKFKTVSEGTAVASERQLETLMASDNILRFQGLSEKEILRTKIAQTKAVIETNMIALEGAIEVRKQTIANAEENQKFLVKILQGLTVPIRFLFYQIDLVGKALGQDFALIDKLDESLKSASSVIFDPDQMRRDGEAADIESKAQLLKLENDWKGYQINLTNIQKDEAAKRKTFKDEEAAKRKTFKDEEADDDVDVISVSPEVKRFKEDLEQKKQAEEAFNAQMDAIFLQNIADDVAAIEKADREKKESKERLDRSVLLGAETTANLLGELANLGEAKNKKQFELQKAASIAAALVSTYLGATKAYASQIVPLDPTSVVRGQIAAAAVVASGLISVAKIKAQKYGGGSTGGGGGGGGIPGGGGGSSQAPDAPTTPVNLDFLKTQPAMKSYVLTDDVKRAAEAGQKIKDLSTL